MKTPADRPATPSKRRLRTVEQLQIREPCSMSLEAMDAKQGGVYFCHKCQKDVHDLSALPRAQAEKVLARGECVSALYNPQGEILFAPDPKNLRALALTAATAAVAAMAMGCNPAAPSGVSAEPPATAQSAAAAGSEGCEDPMAQAASSGGEVMRLGGPPPPPASITPPPQRLAGAPLPLPSQPPVAPSTSTGAEQEPAGRLTGDVSAPAEDDAHAGQGKRTAGKPAPPKPNP